MTTSWPDFLSFLFEYPLPLSPSLSLSMLAGQASKNTSARECPRRRWKKLFIGIIPREIELEKLRLVTHSCDPLYYDPYCATWKAARGGRRRRRRKWRRRRKEEEKSLLLSLAEVRSPTIDNKETILDAGPHDLFSASPAIVSFSFFLSLFAFIETCDSLLCRLCEIIGGRERLRLWFQRGAFWIYPPFFPGIVSLATYDWQRMPR